MFNEKAFCLLQKLRDIFALEVKRTPTSFCGTPSTPCRRRVSAATLSKASVSGADLAVFLINGNLPAAFLPAGSTGRLRPPRWFTRSSEGTSGPEVLKSTRDHRCCTFRSAVQISAICSGTIRLLLPANVLPQQRQTVGYRGKSASLKTPARTNRFAL